jgi:hypothetical protein
MRIPSQYQTNVLGYPSNPLASLRELLDLLCERQQVFEGT